MHGFAFAAAVLASAFTGGVTFVVAVLSDISVYAGSIGR